jgi:hypothetical protein
VAGEILKVSVSGSTAVVSGLDKLGARLPDAMARAFGRAGAVLRWKMQAQLASGSPIGVRSGTGFRSVVAKVGKDKRGIVKLMVFPRAPYMWMNAFGFPRTLIQVGGARMAINTKTGEVRALGPRKKKRKREMQFYEGGYRRFHVLRPRPFAPLVLTANEDMVQGEIEAAINAAQKEAGLASP